MNDNTEKPSNHQESSLILFASPNEFCSQSFFSRKNTKYEDEAKISLTVPKNKLVHGFNCVSTKLWMHLGVF